MLLCFCSITMIGEVLGAMRRDLLTAEDAMEGPWSADTAYRSCWAFMDHRLPVSRRLRRRVQAAMGQDAGCFGSSLTSLADVGIMGRGRSGVCISKERRSCDLQ